MNLFNFSIDENLTLKANKENAYRALYDICRGILGDVDMAFDEYAVNEGGFNFFDINIFRHIKEIKGKRELQSYMNKVKSIIM